MQTVDVAIAGAGIIGLSLALELRLAGLSVEVYDTGEPAQQATHAAGGMLAVNDPENPVELLPLSQLSMALYPEFLFQIEKHSGQRVLYRTRKTLQSYPVSPGFEGIPPLRNPHLNLDHLGHRWLILNEFSLDPRELASALLKACTSAGVAVHANTPFPSPAARFTVLSTGAWTKQAFPRKGQMLAVQLPPDTLDIVVRAPETYIIPRGEGRTVIGATVEDAGFDKTVQPEAIEAVKAKAAQFVPAIADAPVIETWAGLRPATADGLPLLGRLEGNTFVAAGHYRNGILLAPATARILRQQILGESSSVDLTPFAVNRTMSAIFAQ